MAKKISNVSNVEDSNISSEDSPSVEGLYLSLTISSLRLPPAYGATLGVKKLLSTVPLGKPNKSKFFRTHASPDMTFRCLLLEQRDTRETYIVTQEVAQELSMLVSAVELFVAIDRQNNLFLIPVRLPKEDGSRNIWHESLNQAVEISKKKWIRINANMQIGAYDVYAAEGLLPEPDWPEHDIEQIVDIAFKGCIIQSMDHPAVQSLLGRV